MKKLLTLLLLCFALHNCFAQIDYYNVEWTKKNKQDLFTGICKIETDQQHVIIGEIIWRYWAIDSTDQDMTDMYKGKKGKMGIEFIEGNYFSNSHDVIFEGKDKNDPFGILGLDKYSLKLSANKQVLYGTTATEGTNSGLFYATKLNTTAGEKQFLSAKAKVKKNSN